MFYLSVREWMFWGGIAVMVLSAGLGIISGVISFVTGRYLKKRLEEEYGKPQK